MSAFNWNTGQPSCMYTAAGHRAAQAMVKGVQKAIDTRGRAVIDMAPRTAQAITIGKPGDAEKTDRIKRGTSK